MAPDAVLAQALAVVGGEHHQGVGGQPRAPGHAGQQLTDGGVDERHLGVVAVGLAGAAAGGQPEPAGVGVVEEVGGVRLDVVDPEKEGAAAAGVVVEPGQGLLVEVLGGGLAAEQAQPAPAGEHFAVGGEVLGEARQAVAEGPVGDEAGGDVAVPRQDLGQRRQAAADAEAVAGGAVLVRVERGEHRGDRRSGQRLDGARGGEAGGTGEQAVEVGAGGAVVAVAREPVRAQGVDGDEEDVGRSRGGGCRLSGRPAPEREPGPARRPGPGPAARAIPLRGRLKRR